MKVRKRVLVTITSFLLFVFAISNEAFAQSTLVWPVPGHTTRSQGFHKGNAIDISDGNITGAMVVAAMGGTVTHIWKCTTTHSQDPKEKCCYGFGTGIVIQGDDGRIYQYAHMLGGSIPENVYKGAYVSAGQKIGQVGSTGFSTGPHLHFGISLGHYNNASGINPDNETYGTPSTEVSLSFSADRCEPDQSNVFVYTEANTNVSGSFTEAGVTLWDENNQVVVKKSEATSVSGTKLKIYYNITNETGVVLQSGTNYKYQLYTVFNGKRYETTVKTFKTLGQASNAWTSDLTMEDWTYGETAKIPSISAKYGNVVYAYSTEKNGNYSANKPKDAGTYYVKATVVATEEYTGLESVKEFHIRKAVPSYDMPQGIKAVYGQKLSDVQLPDGFVWADATEVVGNVGEKTFAASFVPEDTKNYITVENLKIAVTVEPKDMSGTKLTGIDKNTDLNRYEIKDGDTVLVKDRDYTIDVVKANDKETVKVTFKGNYTGKTETTYSVKNVATNAKNGQKNTAQATDKTNTKNKAAKTGDYTTTELLAMLVVLAGAVILVTGKKRFAK